MNIQRNTSKQSASVLMVTLGICIILGVMALSYLSMVDTQRFSVTRARAWNYAIAVAEAGVEEGMADLNNTNIMKVGLFQGGNKWVNLGGGAICKTNVYLETNAYYNVFIYTQSNSVAPLATSVNPIIIATGIVSGPVSSPPLRRTVMLQASPITSMVPDGAMVATTTVDFKGFNISTDSFQSSNTNLFPGGIWNAPNRRDHGDVSTLSTNSADLNVQNGKMRGTLHTPPNWNASSANIGSSGSVGDNAWVGGGSKGIEMSPSHVKNDATSSYPDATLPTLAAGKVWLPATKGAYVVNGTTYDYYLTPNNPWYINNLSGSIYVAGANVLLQLTGATASIPSGGTIEVPNLTDGSGNPYSLDMYVAATSFTVVGTGVANDGGVAQNLQYYGLPSNTSITLGGNGSITAQIYAPEADFTLGGGGSDTYDFAGMCVVKSVTMNGHFNFHFDESTKDTLHLFGYAVKSWDEL